MELDPELEPARDVIQGIAVEDLRPNVIKFAQFVYIYMRMQSASAKLTEECFYALVFSLKFDIAALQGDLTKEGSVLSGLWVIFLRYYRMFTHDIPFKYHSMDSFMNAYGGHFSWCDATEQIRLFQTANWMELLFRTIPAKRNKVFFLHIVPKFVEGFNVKYKLGSGQSKMTTCRADIFSCESGIAVTHHKSHIKVRNDAVIAPAAVEALFQDPSAVSTATEEPVVVKQESAAESVDADMNVEGFGVGDSTEDFFKSDTIQSFDIPTNTTLSDTWTFDVNATRSLRGWNFDPNDLRSPQGAIKPVPMEEEETIEGFFQGDSLMSFDVAPFEEDFMQVKSSMEFDFHPPV